MKSCHPYGAFIPPKGTQRPTDCWYAMVPLSGRGDFPPKKPRRSGIIPENDRKQVLNQAQFPIELGQLSGPFPKSRFGRSAISKTSSPPGSMSACVMYVFVYGLPFSETDWT